MTEAQGWEQGLWRRALSIVTYEFTSNLTTRLLQVVVHTFVNVESRKLRIIHLYRYFQ